MHSFIFPPSSLLSFFFMSLTDTLSPSLFLTPSSPSLFTPPLSDNRCELRLYSVRGLPRGDRLEESFSRPGIQAQSLVPSFVSRSHEHLPI